MGRCLRLARHPKRIAVAGSSWARLIERFWWSCLHVRRRCVPHGPEACESGGSEWLDRSGGCAACARRIRPVQRVSAEIENGDSNDRFGAAAVKGSVMSKPTTVEEYIAGASGAAAEMLLTLRNLSRNAAPQATEALKWSHPALVHPAGTILFVYSAHKQHA